MSDSRFTILYTGTRGLPGAPGVGVAGPMGPGFRARGTWSSGQTYAPGDAVSSDSSAAQGIASMFVQRITVPESTSLLAPRDDAARWMEIGALDLTNVTGAIWRVIQLAHGFTKVGQPVSYSESAGRWILTSNRIEDPAPVAMVREVVSPNEVVLQASGDITNLDSGAIYPAGATEFVAGRFYFAAPSPGHLTLQPTTAAMNFASNAMLLATGPTQGVVLQWQATPNVIGRRPVGYRSFFYTGAAAQTIITGADLDGNMLAYAASDQNRVLVDGLDLSSRDDFVAADGLTVVLTVPLTGGEDIEIRVLDEPLDAAVPATALMLDSLAPQFDGVTTRFPLTVQGGDPLTLLSSENAVIFLDGNAQEPYTDYLTLAGLATDTDIQFTRPPAAGCRFWGVAGVAITNLAFLNLISLVVQTANIVDLTVDTFSGPIDGGTF